MGDILGNFLAILFWVGIPAFVPVSILASINNWDWFFRLEPRLRRFDNKYGREVARIFAMILTLIGFSGYLMIHGLTFGWIEVEWAYEVYLFISSLMNLGNPC